MYINSGEITTVMLSYFRSATRFILTPTQVSTTTHCCCWLLYKWCWQSHFISIASERREAEKTFQ